LAGGTNNNGNGTIRNSLISGNSVTVKAAAGGVGAGAGGIDDDGSLVLTDSVVRDNHTSAIFTTSDPSSAGGADAGGMEVDGSVTVTHVQFLANSTSVTSPGPMQNPTGGNGGAMFLAAASPVTISDSLIAKNSAYGATGTGVLAVQGGGIFNCSSTLTLRNTRVLGNFSAGYGPSGVVQGGGIFNVDYCNGAPSLTLIDSAIMLNRLTGSSGLTFQGGGLYTVAPVTMTQSTIAENAPDQCYGC
jgi:hypothetical protein